MFRFLSACLDHGKIVIGVWIFIFILGIGAWIFLKKEAYPDIGDTQVTIITTYSGRAAREVEEQITVPVERALSSLPGLINKRSKTIFGLSVIQVTFEDGVDDYFARQRVTEKLQDVSLPPGIQPQLAPLTGPVGEIFRYVIESSEEFSPMQLRTLQDWVIIPKLLQVQGVADVINFGGLVKQFHIVTSPERLVRYGLTLQNVIDAINANNVNTGGNIVARGEQGLAVRAMGAIHGIKDLESIVVTSVKGVPVFVRDLAAVQESPLPPTGVLGYRLKNEKNFTDVDSSVQGLVAMLRGQNPSEVVENLKLKVGEINERWLPKGVRLVVTYDRSDLVAYTLRTVSHTLIAGTLIVLAVLFLFLGSMRAALVVAATIPFSLVFAFLMMKLTNIPANLLSLGAIDFGIIVDGSVVIVENIIRHYRLRAAKAGEVAKQTVNASLEVSWEILFCIAIIICAYIPIFSLERVEGRLFRPMAFTLGFAIFGSLLLSLTLVPVLMTMVHEKVVSLDRQPVAAWFQGVFERLKAKYDSILRGLLARPMWVLKRTGWLVVAIVAFGYFYIGTEFLPNLDEGALNIRALLPVGITLQNASKYTPIMREIIGKNFPVQVILTQLGRNDDGTDPYGPNRVEILVGLKDNAEWENLISKDQLLIKIKSELESAIPGTQFSFSQPILDNVTEAVTGSVADLAILINGEDTIVMRGIAKEVLEIVRDVRGASEAAIEQEPDQAQLVVNVDRIKAARYGINVADIQKMIEAAIGGGSIGKLIDGEKRFDIVVRYSSYYRKSVESIRSMQVPAPNGARIPLADLAELKIVDGPTLIQRENNERQISVRTNIRGRDQGGFVAEARKKVEQKVKLPPGYSMDWGGQFENLARASKRLLIVIPITLLIIFALLSLLYRDIRHVLVALSCIPLSLVGGIVALIVRGYNFNVSAGVGFISLFGIATMSGVLFISRARHLHEDHPELSLADRTLEAASLQLRPRLMTMLLAFLGLVPAAIATGIGSDVQRPLATVVVGGLLSSILLSTTVLPVLYFEAERRRSKGGEVEP